MHEIRITWTNGKELTLNIARYDLDLKNMHLIVHKNRLNLNKMKKLVIDGNRYI